MQVYIVGIHTGRHRIFLLLDFVLPILRNYSHLQFPVELTVLEPIIEFGVLVLVKSVLVLVLAPVVQREEQMEEEHFGE